MALNIITVSFLPTLLLNLASKIHFVKYSAIWIGTNDYRIIELVYNALVVHIRYLPLARKEHFAIQGKFFELLDKLFNAFYIGVPVR